jgi:vacuolar-type H+-ATPase subunit H
MTFNYQEKVKSSVEKRDRLIDKYENNRDSAWNKANKKYKNILTLIKHVVKTGEKYKKKIYDTSSRYSRYLKTAQEEYEKNYKEILDNAR